MGAGTFELNDSVPELSPLITVSQLRNVSLTGQGSTKTTLLVSGLCQVFKVAASSGVRPGGTRLATSRTLGAARARAVRRNSPARMQIMLSAQSMTNSKLAVFVALVPAG